MINQSPKTLEINQFISHFPSFWYPPSPSQNGRRRNERFTLGYSSIMILFVIFHDFLEPSFIFLHVIDYKINNGVSLQPNGAELMTSTRECYHRYRWFQSMVNTLYQQRHKHPYWSSCQKRHLVGVRPALFFDASNFLATELFTDYSNYICIGHLCLCPLFPCSVYLVGFFYPFNLPIKII